ncbi:hypothetical protein [Sulfitobacter sp. R18_1]|uniref:hypothetical protein n=1 Tax=Sulfitobacter sp. R18_1 TaxID=2821104 RepID=UPI001ADB4D35|nr:hypothetical protein [Sulfitobacter sp. R18_1]MBO9432538.1 hypothetical protein [Sulfitobacter sp. R18_1]
MIVDFKNQVATVATELAYSAEEISAGFEFSDRKSRRIDPAGRWDNAGRFYAQERSSAVENCRAPSRKFPWSEMKAARTAAHCAEMAGVGNVTHVRRIALALEKCIGGASEEVLRKLLTPGVKKRKADRSAPLEQVAAARPQLSLRQSF